MVDVGNKNMRGWEQKRETLGIKNETMGTKTSGRRAGGGQSGQTVGHHHGGQHTRPSLHHHTQHVGVIQSHKLELVYLKKI